MPPMLPSSVLGFQCEIWPYGNHVHASSLKTVNCFLRLADDWLVLIEAGVKNHGNPCLLLKRADQIIIKRVLVPCDTLQAPRVVYMIYGAESCSLLTANLVNVQHKWRRMIVFKVFSLPFFENGGSK